MVGISSKALNAGGNGPDCGCPNKKGFNGNEIQNKEFSDGSGLEVYDFNARTYDQQVGRFIQIDPKSEDGGQESLTPYQFGINNPIKFSDPSGECPICPAIPYLIEGVKMAIAAYVSYKVVDANKENIQQVADNISNTLNSTPNKDPGSYTTTHESGKKYHGKGPLPRAEQSAKEKEKKYDDPVTDIDWTPSKDDKEAFKDEAKRIREDGGVQNPNNYNKRNSPGEKYLKKEEAAKSLNLTTTIAASTTVVVTHALSPLIALWGYFTKK